jgi:hypothetical protein
VRQHLADIAPVRRQERLVDELGLVRQAPLGEQIGRSLGAALAGEEGGEQVAAHGAREQQEGVVAQLAGDTRLDGAVVEVGVAVARTRGVARGGAGGEADAREVGAAAAGKHPVEAVEHARVEGAVVLHRAHEAGRDGALGATVGPVHEHELVDRTLPREVVEHAVQLGLKLLVAHQAVAAVGLLLPREVKEAPAGEAPIGPLQGVGAVVVEEVAQVAGRVAEVAARLGQGELEVRVEAQHPALALEARTLLLQPEAHGVQRGVHRWGG